MFTIFVVLRNHFGFYFKNIRSHNLDIVQVCTNCTDGPGHEPRLSGSNWTQTWRVPRYWLRTEFKWFSLNMTGKYDENKHSHCILSLLPERHGTFGNRAIWQGRTIAKALLSSTEIALPIAFTVASIVFVWVMLGWDLFLILFSFVLS